MKGFIFGMYSRCYYDSKKGCNHMFDESVRYLPLITVSLVLLMCLVVVIYDNYTDREKEDDKF